LTSPPTGPTLTFGSVDHAELGRRAQRLGGWYFVEYRTAAERPFLAASLATALGNPLLYLSAMGLGLGAIVDQPVGGVPYLLFVAPALLVSTVVTTGANWGTWPIMGGFKWQRSYLAAHAAPLSPAQLSFGETAAITFRLLAQAAIFWVLGLPFGAWPGVGSLWLIPISTLAALAMFTPLMAYAATQEDEGLQFNFINRLIVMPMFLFAGTFFPLEAMPTALQWVGWVSPMWHGTQLARMASYGMPNPAWLTLVHGGFLVVCVLVGQLLAHRTFTRRLVG